MFWTYCVQAQPDANSNSIEAVTICPIGFIIFIIERLGWPDSSVDSLFCLPLRARCTAQPLVGILIFFPQNSNLFTSSCVGLPDRQAIWVRFSILHLGTTMLPSYPPAGSHDIPLIPTSGLWGVDPPRGHVPHKPLVRLIHRSDLIQSIFPVAH